VFPINDPSNAVEAQMRVPSKIPVSFSHNFKDLNFSEFMLDFHPKRRQFSIMLLLFFGETLSFFALKRECDFGRYFL
jgi:hypothetical protein